VVEEVRGFKKLLAWQKADELASAVFHAVEPLPAQHRWLASQISRASVSVPANIAEGYGRGSLGDYLRFLDIARGSLSEVEYYVHFLGKEHFLSESDVEKLSRLRSETGFLLHRLWVSLKAKTGESWDHSGGSRQVREVAADLYNVEELWHDLVPSVPSVPSVPGAEPGGAA
jgi:four helix bundle protein